MIYYLSGESSCPASQYADCTCTSCDLNEYSAEGSLVRSDCTACSAGEVVNSAGDGCGKLGYCVFKIKIFKYREL